MLFKNIKPVDSTGDLTKKVAMSIYNKLKTQSPSEVFSDPNNNSSFDWQHIQIVYDEAKEIESIINELMSGNSLISAEEFHFDEESGEKIVDKEAVYYIPSTKNKLISDIETEYLDVEIIINDIIDSLTWTEFKDSFK